MSVFFQILAAALVIALIRELLKYLRWRRAVVRFVTSDIDELPHSTELEEQKSLALAWKLIGRIVGEIPKARRAEALANSWQSSQSGIMMFALMSAMEAKEAGTLKDNDEDLEGYVKTMMVFYSVKQ